MTPRKLCLVIPDSDVIIELHKLGYWQSIVSSYDIKIAETVFGEARFYENSSGRMLPTDLPTNKVNHDIEVFDLDAIDLSALEHECRRMKAPEIDDGERESIAAVITEKFPDCRVCLIDRAAITCTVMVGRGGQCISVENLLKSIGIATSLPEKLTDRRFQRIHREATEQRIYNM